MKNQARVKKTKDTVEKKSETLKNIPVNVTSYYLQKPYTVAMYGCGYLVITIYQYNVINFINYYHQFSNNNNSNREDNLKQE